ncbi:MAG: hypothetical protein P8H48_01750 [Flavobacteriaceae bacterium]|nr:hypothetical protein [Flavobacteriaceae bacterium]
MKYFLLIFFLLILGCSSNDDGSNSATGINPPSWIQGVYLQEISGQVLPVGYEFKTNDFCTIASFTSCNKALLDMYDGDSNFETNVHEEIDSNRYSIEITLGSIINKYEFIKSSNTSIKQILITGDEAFYTLQ